MNNRNNIFEQRFSLKFNLIIDWTRLFWHFWQVHVQACNKNSNEIQMLTLNQNVQIKQNYVQQNVSKTANKNQ